MLSSRAPHRQGTKVEGTIARLFEGHMHMFIECIGMDVKSTRRESYMDLQLDVKGAADIYASFDKYCEVEVMDGANQYKTDDHGLQVGAPRLARPAFGSLGSWRMPGSGSRLASHWRQETPWLLPGCCGACQCLCRAAGLCRHRPALRAAHL